MNDIGVAPSHHSVNKSARAERQVSATQPQTSFSSYFLPGHSTRAHSTQSDRHAAASSKIVLTLIHPGQVLGQGRAENGRWTRSLHSPRSCARVFTQPLTTACLWLNSASCNLPSARRMMVSKTWLRESVAAFKPGGALQPFRLLRQDWRNLPKRYVSDWTVFNQLIFASAVYVFFTNLLPGITFASDLYNLTGKNWGTIEVVFSTGLCGMIFSL